jgi:hypothetical protein
MPELTFDQLGDELIITHQKTNQAIKTAKGVREQAEAWVAYKPTAIESIKNYREAEEKVTALRNEESSLIKRMIKLIDPNLVWGADHLNKPIFIRNEKEGAESFYALVVDKMLIAIYEPNFKLELIEK